MFVDTSIYVKWCLYHPDKGFQCIFIIQSPQFLMKGSTTLRRDNLFSFLYPMMSLLPPVGISMYFHHPVNTFSNERLYHPEKG